jgi:capsular exopolysaccharide synthesis family protein
MNDRDNLPVPRRDAGLPAAYDGEYGWSGDSAEGVGEFNAFSPRRLLRAVLRYKWLVLALAVAGGTTALFATRFLELSYTAEARLWIQAVTRNDAAMGPIRSSELLQNDAWLELLGSNAVLDSAVMQQKLYVQHEPGDADVMADLIANEESLVPGAYVLRAGADGALELRTEDGALVERVRGGEVVGSSIGLVWRPTLAQSDREVAFTLMSPRDAVGHLNRRLDARLARGGNFMWISYTAEDPEHAARVANAVATRYVEVAAELKRAKLDELRDILERQLEFAENNLREAELALERFRVATITLPSEAPVAAGLDETRAPVMTAFFDLKMQRDALARDRQAIQRAVAPRDGISVDALSAVPTVRQSPELMQALTELSTKRAERRALLLQFTEEHPQVVRATADIQQLERQAVPALAQRLVAELGQQLAQLDGQVGSASDELRQIPSRAIDQARFRRDVMTAENLFNDLRGRYEGARLAAETTVPDIRILDSAHPPRNPSLDQRLGLMFAGFAGSLALGLLLAVALDRLDPRLRYADQVTDGLGLAVIGAVPSIPASNRLRNGGSSNGVATRGDPQVIESLRAIRLNLMHAYGAAGPMLVTVTSPGAGDGKTFMTSNLALSYADLGRRTLIIDGDTRRGCMHRLFSLDRRPGLTEFLRGDVQLDDVIRPTAYDLIEVIPCGARLQNAPELLSSSLLGDLLAAVRARYDTILIDSPPLGAGVDPLVLGALTGNVLLVMRTGNTERALAEAKLRMLDRLPVRVLGTVLNGFDASDSYRYYSYMPGYETGDEEEDVRPALLQRG